MTQFERFANDDSRSMKSSANSWLQTFVTDLTVWCSIFRSLLASRNQIEINNLFIILSRADYQREFPWILNQEIFKRIQRRRRSHYSILRGLENERYFCLLIIRNQIQWLLNKIIESRFSNSFDMIVSTRFNYQRWLNVLPEITERREQNR